MGAFIKKIVSGMKNKSSGPSIKKKKHQGANRRAIGIGLAVVSIISIGVDGVDNRICIECPARLIIWRTFARARAILCTYGSGQEEAKKYS